MSEPSRPSLGEAVAAARQKLAGIEDPLETLAAFFALSPFALQVFHANGHCLFVNRAFVDLFGVEPPPEFNVLRELDGPHAEQARLTARAFRGETISIPPFWFDPRELTQVHVTEGRRVAVEMMFFPIYDAHGEVRYAANMIRDVTEQWRLQEQVQQVQRMEAIGRLAGGVAHDFNNLLTVILSYSSMALRNASANQQLSSDMKEIQRAAQRAAQLTQQLLAFGRKQILEPRVLSLNGIVRDAEKMLRRILGEDIQLELNLARELHHAKADAGQLDQVLLNLVVNARDAMPTGGTLTIETRNVAFDEKSVADHPKATPGPYVQLALTDTGIGMSPEVKARIFDPFFTTKERGKGTGLGLATVLGIVEQSGGLVHVQSEPGRGSAFRISLPATMEALEAPKPLAVPDLLGRGEVVLVVEDEDRVRRLVVRILAEAGYVVLDAASNDAALRLAAERTEAIHLLLTDVVMPHGSGPELAQALTAVRPNLKVLFMSGYAEDAIARHGVLHPGAMLVQKPVAPVQLLARVREALGDVEEP